MKKKFAALQPGAPGRDVRGTRILSTMRIDDDGPAP